MKRAEMSIGVVVGLAIALIVLVLIMTLLITRFDIFGKGTGQIQTGTDARLCSKQSGHCEIGPDCVTGGKTSPPLAQSWIDCAGVCCKP
jgi:hypothetical protein